MSEQWSDSGFAYNSQRVERVLSAIRAVDNFMYELPWFAIYGALAVKFELFRREEQRIITAIDIPSYTVKCRLWTNAPGNSDHRVGAATAHECGALLIRDLYLVMFPEKPGIAELKTEADSHPGKTNSAFISQVMQFLNSQEDQLLGLVKVALPTINYDEIRVVVVKMKHERYAILPEGFVLDEPDDHQETVGEKSGETGREKGGYLGLIVDLKARTIRRVGEDYVEVVVDLSSRKIPWVAFCIMFKAEGRELTADEWDNQYTGEKDGQRQILSELRNLLLPLDVTVQRGKKVLITANQDDNGGVRNF